MSIDNLELMIEEVPSAQDHVKINCRQRANSQWLYLIIIKSKSARKFINDFAQNRPFSIVQGVNFLPN